MCLRVQMGYLDMGQLDLKYMHYIIYKKIGFKAFESVITDGKLLIKYGNLRKRSEGGKIIFAFVSDYFYRYRFHFFLLPLPFSFRPENQEKKLENDF